MIKIANRNKEWMPLRKIPNSRHIELSPDEALNIRDYQGMIVNQHENTPFIDYMIESHDGTLKYGSY